MKTLTMACATLALLGTQGASAATTSASNAVTFGPTNAGATNSMIIHQDVGMPVMQFTKNGNAIIKLVNGSTHRIDVAGVDVTVNGKASPTQLSGSLMKLIGNKPNNYLPPCAPNSGCAAATLFTPPLKIGVSEKTYDFTIHYVDHSVPSDPKSLSFAADITPKLAANTLSFQLKVYGFSSTVYAGKVYHAVLYLFNQ